MSRAAGNDRKTLTADLKPMERLGLLKTAAPALRPPRAGGASAAKCRW
jgi:hypothetical protein